MQDGLKGLGDVPLLIGIVANGLAVAVGTTLGLIAGYVRGFIGMVIMRFTDLMMAFPPLLLAIALAAILKPGLSIVPITATPYAFASRLDDPNPMTAAATTASRIQFTAGT